MRTLLPFAMAFLLTWSATLFAQTPIDARYKEATILKIGDMIEQFYVFPDVARTTSEHLNKQLMNGVFNEYSDAESFAKALTNELQSANKDKHMRVGFRPLPKKRDVPMSPDERSALLADRLNSSRGNMAGFNEVKRLEGNIGYLDLRGFAPVSEGAPVADAYMRLLQDSDAIILDMRKNGGGSPEMVQYLCSYFFDKGVHLNSIYNRERDATMDYLTLEKVNGTRMPDVPLFVLTSNYTFSGGEEFCYNMQTRKRATLIGETTGGGANPGGTRRINEHLVIFIPDGTAINPVTRTNWEGVGVVPEITTTAEEAMDKAMELAAKAAKDYRQRTYDASKSIISALLVEIDKVSTDNLKEQQGKVHDQLKVVVEQGILSEADINDLGYQQMGERQLNKAEAIFWSNTQLFPESPNTYDSYAEALANNNKKDLAIANYEKAIEVAKRNDDPGIALYESNLAKLKKGAQ